jgi:hypothetical protein
MSQNNIELKNEETKVWLGGDGIIRIKTGGAWGEEAMEFLMKEIIEIRKNLATKPKILVNLGLAPHISSTIYRRSMVGLAKEALKKIDFERVAVYGGIGKRVQKIVVSFITTAAGIKNIKLFETEEEALRWLKEE